MRELIAFLPYVVRTTFRARLRTLLTVAGATLAMALFAFVRTVDRGLDDLAGRASRPVLVVYQDSRFCPTTSLLPVRYRPAIEEVDGVRAVLPTLIAINSCRANLDLVTIHGVDPATLRDVYDLEPIEGDLDAWAGRPDGTIVGERLARRRGLRVGERVRLENCDLYVGGIFRGEAAGIDNVAFVALDTVARARGRLGMATEFLVALDDRADPPRVASEIDARFASDEARTDTKSMQAFVAGAVGELAELVGFARGLGYLSVVIVALVLANTVYISAQARATEMGVLETIGLTRVRLAGLITLEGVGLGVLGGVLGAVLVLGFLLARPLTLGVEGYGIDFRAQGSVAWQTVLASVVVGLLASVGPAIEAVRRPLVRSLKVE